MRIIQSLISICALVVGILFVVTAQDATAQDTKFVRTPRDAFVFNCDFRRTAKIDPIVYPGQYGASHRHVFFGGRVTKDSTYKQLRSGDTTCQDSARGVQTKDHKSGYWLPALRRNGEEIPAIRTDAKFYYGVPEGTPTADLQPLPRGVKVIAGSGQSTGPQYGIVDWGCGNAPGGSGKDGKKRGYLAPVDCDPDSSNPYVNVTVHFPSCWTGAKDSSDHKSHAAYPVGYPQDPDAWRCPEGYPIRTPRLDLTVRFRTSNADNLRLSSGSIYSMHADVFEASNQAYFERLIDTEL